MARLLILLGFLTAASLVAGAVWYARTVPTEERSRWWGTWMYTLNATALAVFIAVVAYLGQHFLELAQ